MDLMCKSKTQRGLIGSINYVGFALFSVFGPRLTDHVGRKRVIIPGLFLCIFAEAMLIFVCRSFPFMISMMFVYGCSGTFRISLMYLYMQELTPKSKQPLVGTIIHVVNGITATMSVIYTEYIYDYWVPYQAAVLGIIILCTILLLAFAPESPKYLITKKRYDEARDVLRLMARANQKEVNFREIAFEQEVLDSEFNNGKENVNEINLTNSFAS